MKCTSRTIQAVVGTVFALAAAGLAVAQTSFGTRFSNIGSVANTRHNLTQNTADGGIPGASVSGAMITVRNNYGEVCVYCHTPHGANNRSEVARLPLWNRTYKAVTYQTYDLGSQTITQPVTQPGANSLSCLSCHDGTIAIDSIINMPGSGQYSATAMTGHDEAHLNRWTPPPGYARVATPAASNHAAIGTSSPSNPGLGCMSCHAGVFAANFAAFNIGTDLRNDHPVGVRFPPEDSPNSRDYKQPAAVVGNVRYFDKDGNGHLDSNDIRLYNTGDGFEVECASCHDPHGVPSAGKGTPFIPTFLRVANDGSAVCMTCHNK